MSELSTGFKSFWKKSDKTPPPQNDLKIVEQDPITKRSMVRRKLELQKSVIDQARRNEPNQPSFEAWQPGIIARGC